jgi:hypothetical protein
MTFEDLDAWRKARTVVMTVSGLIASTRRRFVGKTAAGAALTPIS